MIAAFEIFNPQTIPKVLDSNGTWKYMEIMKYVTFIINFQKLLAQRKIAFINGAAIVSSLTKRDYP